MPVFLSLSIRRKADNPGQKWQDISTGDYFIFESPSVRLMLRKRHSYPATFAYLQDSVLHFGYGDEQCGVSVAAKPLHAVQEDTFYGGEFLFGRVLPDGSLELQRDAHCTLPLFVIDKYPHVVIISNSYDHLLLLNGREGLCIDNLGLCEFIANFDVPHRTYLQNITVLGERSRLAWHYGGKLRREWPPDSSHLNIHKSQAHDPRAFRRYFEEILDEYVSRYATGEVVGCELSGGLDSAIITGSLAIRGLRPLSVTLEFPDEFGISQMAKISDLERRFLLPHPYTVSLGRLAPFPLSRLLDSKQPKPFYQYDSVYREAFEMLAAHLASRGVETVFIGVGGDELCAYDENPVLATGEGHAAHVERLQRPLWPFLNEHFRAYYEQSLQRIPYERTNAVPLTATASLAARLTHNNMYIEHNIWPVAPLADPRLFLYCQGLPLQYRANKNILRMYCLANEYPASLYNDTRNENFGPYFSKSARRYHEPLLKSVLEKSVLAASHFIKADEVMDWFYHIRPVPSEADAAYYDAHRLITLEYNLQSLGLTHL